MPTPNVIEPGTAQVVLPEGMSVEDFNKAFASFNKMRDYTAKRDKAVRNALNSLKTKYPTDYAGFLAVELKNAGLPVK